ncbi:uncharacterized protein LOC115722178 isoform X1 [Cannabis sativa]|uniref:uncharacterized protein LOC115722178 isoform X1 n=1 Tax=Cannabis sativa TaxID=3483 RepID=UPI0029CA4B22|nr:uncharacterized protein LOC115722178 isoform X1 [Cannabis sativa]
MSSSLKVGAKLFKFLLCSNNTISRSRVFVTVATRPLQVKSKKEQDEVEACEKAKEAAEAIKSGAKEVRETCEFIRDTVETTTQSVSKVIEKVETMKDKAQGSLSGVVNVAQKATDVVKEFTGDDD